MPAMRWRQARSAEARCLWSSWRGVSAFSTPLCVSAPVQAQPRPYRSAKRPDLAKRPPAARATRQPSPRFRLPITSFAGHANLDLLASPARSGCFIRVALSGQSGSPEGAMVVVRPSEAAGRKASRGLDRTVISLRRMALGSGYRSWMKSVAVGDRLRSRTDRSGNEPINPGCRSSIGRADAGAVLANLLLPFGTSGIPSLVRNGRTNSGKAWVER
jgi:hypothetical protein